jgi:hypothetical protein
LFCVIKIGNYLAKRAFVYGLFLFEKKDKLAENIPTEPVLGPSYCKSGLSSPISTKKGQFWLPFFSKIIREYFISFSF